MNDLDKLCVKLLSLNNYIAGYLLGFPIHVVTPDDNQIRDAILHLRNIGSEEYVKHIASYVERTYLPSLPFPLDCNYITAIDSGEYVPFDIVGYRSGKSIYRFIRSALPRIMGVYS